MANDKMMAQMSSKPGFIAALDQSGGSTPGALRLYGIPDSEYKGDDAEMFELVHEMRVRIITAPAFTGDKVIAAILFERTMDGEAKGKPVPTYLWEERGVVPFVKVDKGLEAEKDGVSLMKPMPDLDQLLDRATKLGIFGTKMRFDHQPRLEKRHRRDREAAVRVRRTDPKPWPHADPRAGDFDQEPRQGRRRAILLDELTKGLDALPAGRKVMFKLTLPEVPDFYHAADQGQAGRPRRRAVRRLHPGRRVRTPRRKSWHDRELLARARRRALSDRCPTPTSTRR